MNVTGKTKHTKQRNEAFNNCLRSHCLARKHEREATKLINDNQEVLVVFFFFCAGNRKVNERLKSVRVRFDSVLTLRDSIA